MKQPKIKDRKKGRKKIGKNKQGPTNDTSTVRWPKTTTKKTLRKDLTDLIPKRGENHTN